MIRQINCETVDTEFIVRTNLARLPMTEEKPMLCSEYILLNFLIHLADGEQIPFEVSEEWMAETIGISARTAKRALARLADCGYIRKTQPTPTKGKRGWQPLRIVVDFYAIERELTKID